VLQKHLSALTIALGLIVLSALPASANTLSMATATVVCTGYTLTVVTNNDLDEGVTYTINYSFAGICAARQFG
jgi:hypothetical protein